MRVAIVLAAGRSRRFGTADKRMARLGGRRLLDRALAMARAAPVGRVLLVIDCQLRMRPAGVTIVRARRARAGLGESLKAGLRVLRPRETELFLFLGDMPAVPRWLAGRLARGSAVRPVFAGQPGHPVHLMRPDAALVERLSGDRGLGALLTGTGRTLRGPRGAVLDVDRPGDLRLARALSA